MSARSRLRIVGMSIVAATTGCGGATRPSGSSVAPLRVGQTTPGCVVADTGVARNDALYIIGGMVADPGARAARPECSALLAAATPAPFITFLSPPAGTDLRDALDRGLPPLNAPRPDVVVTHDPDVIAYATQSGGYRSVELPWNATWVLVVATGDSSPPIPTLEQRDALARDAVKADARGAMAPFEWQANAACTAAIPAPPTPPRPIVAYPAHDAVARQLAERVVALAGTQAPPDWIPRALVGVPLRTAAVESDPVASVLGEGRALAMVMPVPRDPDGACGTQFGWSVPQHAVPLVDVRAHALIRRGSGAAFIIAADGSLFFLKAGVP